MANRIGRRELLFWFATSVALAAIALAIISARAHEPLEPGRTWYPWSQAIWLVLVALVMLRAAVCRFHDLGWASWSVLVMAIPFISPIALLFLLLAPGQKEPNSYGDPPIFLERFRTGPGSRKSVRVAIKQ